MVVVVFFGAGVVLIDMEAVIVDAVVMFVCRWSC